MKLGIWTLFGLMMVGAIATTPRAIAQDTQPMPVEPQQNDARTAIGQINPKKPIQIRVVSQTKAPVVVALGTVASDRVLAPGTSVTYGRLHTSYLPLPLNLQVTLQDTPDPNNPVSVNLIVKRSGNEVMVTVKTILKGSGNSSQTLYIDEKGAIFVY